LNVNQDATTYWTNIMHLFCTTNQLKLFNLCICLSTFEIPVCLFGSELYEDNVTSIKPTHLFPLGLTKMTTPFLADHVVPLILNIVTQIQLSQLWPICSAEVVTSLISEFVAICSYLFLYWDGEISRWPIEPCTNFYKLFRSQEYDCYLSKLQFYVNTKRYFPYLFLPIFSRLPP